MFIFRSLHIKRKINDQKRSQVLAVVGPEMSLCVLRGQPESMAQSEVETGLLIVALFLGVPGSLAPLRDLYPGR